MLWSAGCKLATYYDLGPIYILCSILIFMFTHLGKRKEGEMSAYSLFNEGGERLPGDLGDVIEGQLRRGQFA